MTLTKTKLRIVRGTVGNQRDSRTFPVFAFIFFLFRIQTQICLSISLLAIFFFDTFSKFIPQRNDDAGVCYEVAPVRYVIAPFDYICERSRGICCAIDRSRYEESLPTESVEKVVICQP